MNKFLQPCQEYAYAAMRVVVGFLFACHGAQILFGALGGQAAIGDPMMLVGGSIEFFGGILIALGLITSYTAFLASGTMAVAYFKYHAPHGFWPVLNQGELSVAYCFVFLYIAFRGSGAISLDELLKKYKGPI
jgi:putative oxidoreductase